MSLGEGYPLNEVVKEGYFLKDVILPLLACLVWKLLQIGTDMLHIITSTGDGLSRFISIDDVEWPLTQKKVFREFFAILACDTFYEWIAPKWLQIDLDSLRRRTDKAVARLMSFVYITCPVPVIDISLFFAFLGFQLWHIICFYISVLPDRTFILRSVVLFQFITVTDFLLK